MKYHDIYPRQLYLSPYRNVNIVATKFDNGWIWTETDLDWSSSKGNELFLCIFLLARSVWRAYDLRLIIEAVHGYCGLSEYFKKTNTSNCLLENPQNCSKVNVCFFISYRFLILISYRILILISFFSLYF